MWWFLVHCVGLDFYLQTPIMWGFMSSLDMCKNFWVKWNFNHSWIFNHHFCKIPCQTSKVHGKSFELDEPWRAILMKSWKYGSLMECLILMKSYQCHHCVEKLSLHIKFPVAFFAPVGANKSHTDFCSSKIIMAIWLYYNLLRFSHWATQVMQQMQQSNKQCS